jgi:hypothetical protein
MRSSFWLCLIALGVSVAVIRVSSSAARSDPTPPAAAAPVSEPPAARKGKLKKVPRGAVERAQRLANAKQQAPTQPANDPAWVVEGYGESAADAEEDSLRRARQSVQEYLDKHYGSLASAPSLEQLQKAGVVGLEGSPELRKLEDSDKVMYEVQVAHAQVKLTRGYREGLQKLVLLQHTRQRQWLTARVLAGVVALLLVCGGYLRLEEATRGYYTRLLRLAALGTLAGVGAGLWLL